jgi:hypothetical protein
MEQGEYPIRLRAYLERQGLPDQTISNIGRMCRHGYMSAESALALLEEVEHGRQQIDNEMAGKLLETVVNDGSMSHST